MTYHRDGVMRVDGNYGSMVDYEPNSFGGPVEDRGVTEPPLRIDGNASRYDYKNDDEDYYGQPRIFWEKVLDDKGRANLVKNIVGSMINPAMGIADPRPIQERMLKHWYKIHPGFRRGGRQGHRSRKPEDRGGIVVRSKTIESRRSRRLFHAWRRARQERVTTWSSVEQSS